MTIESKQSAKPAGKFTSVTKLGQMYGLTVAKTKAVLSASGLVDAGGAPTQLAKDLNAFNMVEAPAKYGEERIITFAAWDPSVVGQFFTAPDPVSEFCFVKNRYQAEDKFCEAIVLAGEKLGLSVNSDASPKLPRGLKLSNAAAEAFVECKFNDPHFIGGPSSFVYSSTAASANAIFDKAEGVVSELHAALLKKHPSDANFLREVMDRLRLWLVKAAR